MRDLTDINYITVPGREEVGFAGDTYKDKTHLAQVLERREKLAGRRLTNNELAQGLIQDHRGAGDKIRAGHGELTKFQQDAHEPNVFKSRAVRELIERKQVQLGKPVDRAEYYGEAAADEDKKLAAKAAAEARYNEPARVRLRVAAQEALEFARFSRDSNVDILHRAVLLVDEVDRDVPTAQAIYSGIMDALQANATARRKQLDSEVELLRERAIFEPEPEQQQ